MRSVALYARSRRLSVTIAAAVATGAVFWGLGRLVDGFDPALLTALGAAAGVAVAGPGLGWMELERTTAIRWARRRAVHLVLVVAMAVVAVSAVAVADDLPMSLVVRDAVGLGGLLALGAVTLGAERSWVLPVTWTLAAWTLPGVPANAGKSVATTAHRVLTWIAEPAVSVPAGLAGWTLGAVGLAVFAWRGART